MVKMQLGKEIRLEMQCTKTLKNCINFGRLKGKAQHVIKSTARAYWQDYCSTLDNSTKLGTVWRMAKKTRSSADADKPARRIWRSVKVTKHRIIPYVRYFPLLQSDSDWGCYRACAISSSLGAPF